MQEYQVTIAGESYKVPTPFLVMATQNPIESEGTYPLPEAQVDRFMMKVLVGYPTPEEEFVIVERVTGAVDRRLAAVANTQQLLELQAACRKVYVDPALIQYVVRLVTATRDPAAHNLPDLARYLTYGASPRASINLIEGGRALAYLRGRDYVLPEDLIDLAPDVLRHRLVLSYEALADGHTPDSIVSRLMNQAAPPAKPLESPCPSRRKRLKRSCAGLSGRSCDGSMGCCTAAIARCSAGRGSTSRICANISSMTMCATSTGM